jgi:hypothetical protein
VTFIPTTIIELIEEWRAKYIKYKALKKLIKGTTSSLYFNKCRHRRKRTGGIEEEGNRCTNPYLFMLYD